MRAPFAALLAVIACLWTSNAALAEDPHHIVVHGPLTITDVFSRASPKVARAGAVFMTITSSGDGDRLIGASVAPDVSDTVELHTHIHDNGVMRMRPVDAIEVPAKGTVVLKPGGLHVMLMGLKHPLLEGQHIPVTLTFEKSGDVVVEALVLSMGAMSAQ